MSNKQVHTEIQVGDTVFWFQSRHSTARPWPATVLSVQDGDALDLNIHQPNRIMCRQVVLHRSDTTLERWGQDELQHQGLWSTREEYAEMQATIKTEADARAAARDEAAAAAKADAEGSAAAEPPKSQPKGPTKPKPELQQV